MTINLIHAAAPGLAVANHSSQQPLRSLLKEIPAKVSF
jgi:hypothetical protein